MDLLPWYRVCTKAIFISKEKLQVWRFQKCLSLVGARTPLTCVRHQTIPCHMSRYKAENAKLRKLGLTYHHGIVFAPRQCLYQRKIKVCRDRKCICLVGAKTPPSCAGRQTTPSQGSRYWPENGNLRKMGWTYRIGTVFVPRQYPYQKENKRMERPEMYLPSQCKNPSYLCRPLNYRISREAV